MLDVVILCSSAPFPWSRLCSVSNLSKSVAYSSVCRLFFSTTYSIVGKSSLVVLTVHLDLGVNNPYEKTSKV